MKSITILGLDPGSIWLGWGFISVEDDNLKYIDSGVLHVTGAAAINARLKVLGEQLKALHWELKPTYAAMESGFVGKYPNAALALGKAQGVCIASVGSAITDYKPAQVKRAVSSGNADKKEVAEAVKLILGIDKDFKRDDESDSLAVAICHANELRVRAITEVTA